MDAPRWHEEVPLRRRDVDIGHWSLKRVRWLATTRHSSCLRTLCVGDPTPCATHHVVAANGECGPPPIPKVRRAV